MSVFVVGNFSSTCQCIFAVLIQGVDGGQSRTPVDDRSYTEGKNQKNTNVRADQTKRCEISVIDFASAIVSI